VWVAAPEGAARQRPGKAGSAAHAGLWWARFASPRVATGLSTPAGAAEPALPGRWRRPLRGEQATRS